MEKKKRKDDNRIEGRRKGNRNKISEDEEERKIDGMYDKNDERIKNKRILWNDGEMGNNRK